MNDDGRGGVRRKPLYPAPSEYDNGRVCDMGYLTRLGAGAADQPIQAAQEPPVRAVPVAPQPAEPVGAVREPPEAEAVAAAQEPPKAEAAPAPREEAPKEAQEAPQVGGTPVGPIQLDAPAADAARKAHEAAEAQRRAEWEAGQARKKAERQAALDKLAAMSDADAIRESTRRVGDATEKITRRNMKEQVAEHVQALCQRDPTFARRTMLPGKSMVLCFQYLTKKAFEYVQDEMKANGIEPGPGQEGYGCDVPDDLCFQWARDYFDAPVEEKEEKFVPNPYVPRPVGKAKKDKPKKEPKPKPAPKPKENPGIDGQISLLGG